MSVNKKWFIPNDETLVAYGPFSTSEIVEKIRSGSLKLDNYIWSEERGQDWLRLFEVDEFKNCLDQKPICKVPTNIDDKSVKSNLNSVAENPEKKDEYGRENVFRRFPRAPYEASVILSDDKKGCLVTSIDICENGISIKVNNNFKINNTDEFTITIRNFPELGTFSVRSVVLREFKIEEQNVIGFYFLNLNPKYRRLIAKYVFGKLKELNQEQQAS